ncbi:MAG: sensor domain-containing diguanylate cyclase [Candidatus Anaerobiospirillum pullicola]|uniref:Sensor domain-containing diguanylate cyclase n=1 Tax=Candidatus Anaerobiospirillum pullicola TaxID=2838451 RepID=A0A948TIC8_9GAMM|nr:sensor domain-containing diguanylate cyclase [Candidatus Anaerobiospirillum pullicola]
MSQPAKESHSSSAAADSVSANAGVVSPAASASVASAAAASAASAAASAAASTFPPSPALTEGATFIASPEHGIPNESSDSNDLGMKAVYKFSQLCFLPGTALFILSGRKVIFDRYAAQLLGLGEVACVLRIQDVLRYFGANDARRFFACLRGIRDAIPTEDDIAASESPSGANLRLTVPHGHYAGSEIYVRVAAFFGPKHEIESLSFSFSRQIPNRLAVIPDILSINAGFTWLVPDNLLVLAPNYYERLGYQRQDHDLVLDFNAWENYLVHPQDRNIKGNLADFLSGRIQADNFELCFRTRRLDGTYVWTRTIATVIARDTEGRALCILGHNSYINEVVDSFDKLRTKIYTDVLTGLKNRVFFSRHISDYVQPQMQPLAVIFIDATGLKVYNDYLGHSVGDKLLFSVASLLQEHLTKDNTLVRISGDEIVGVIPHCTPQQLQEIEADLEQALQERNAHAPLRMPVFFSYGSVSLDLNEELYYERFYASLPEEIKASLQQDQALLQQHQEAQCAPFIKVEVLKSLAKAKAHGVLTADRGTYREQGSELVSEHGHEQVTTTLPVAPSAQPAQVLSQVATTDAVLHSTTIASAAATTTTTTTITNITTSTATTNTTTNTTTSARTRSASNTPSHVATVETPLAPTPRQARLLKLWQQWVVDKALQDQGVERLLESVQQSDLLMQQAKKRNRESHYGLIKSYIEHTTKKKVNLADKRIGGMMIS